MRRSSWCILAAIIVGLASGAAAIGQDLPKLPGEMVIAQAPDSPGKVTFLHVSHMGDRPDCTACHPKHFKIVKRGAAARNDDRITHAKMEKGRQCGACHNGKASFGFDDCTLCHK